MTSSRLARSRAYLHLVRYPLSAAYRLPIANTMRRVKKTAELKKAAAREKGKQRAEEVPLEEIMDDYEFDEEVQLFVNKFCPQIELRLPFSEAQIEELVTRWFAKQRH